MAIRCVISQSDLGVPRTLNDYKCQRALYLRGCRSPRRTTSPGVRFLPAERVC